jgi:hypothetical protein
MKGQRSLRNISLAGSQPAASAANGGSYSVFVMKYGESVAGGGARHVGGSGMA